jgi:Mrp family chromosome partitioning ATPase
MRQLIHKWRGEFDYIVINVESPLPATEAAIMATFADVLLLIVRPGITTTQAFKSIRKRLAEALPLGSRMGVVFDGVPEQATEFCDFFGETSTVGGTR